MIIEINKKAPAFTLKDKDGIKISLKDIKSKYTLVYFYPKDNTSGCTTEATEFSKYKNQLEKEGISIIGISGGDEKTKTKFVEKNKLKITLLSDPEFKISNKYSVYGEKKFMGRTYIGIKRTSFLLDENKKIIKIYNKVKPAEHAKEVLEDVKELKKNK